MTPEQAIKKEIIIRFLPFNTLDFGCELTDQNIDWMYKKLIDYGYHWDYESEFRQGDVDTNIEPDWSTHYESKSVATKLTDGTWVGWTYWYGGGKHSEPQGIPWMQDAYFLDCIEYEKTVIVREFKKNESSTESAETA